MSRKILIINGSTRENGNTDNLLNSLMGGITAAGNSFNHIILRDNRINNCIGCYTCKYEGRCFIDDGVTEIRKAIEASHKIVFASPVYFTGVTGLMKTFFDRLFFYYHENNKSAILGREAMVISIMNQTDLEKEAYLLKKYYKVMLKCIGLLITDMLFFTDLMEKEAHKKYPQYYEKLYNLGFNL